ncbi:uncharacterized protein LOC122429059 isoform X5 [Cervus canadensis]|uniref:uncharacterized protein LOC122429059 isoform X5 n=1 Tax=Cervus canadensis TaxID=1574408 RepID=UPI001CA35A84|nr:uncharacterized protein LOC122429059 isoform X5 [Cervus canadensis]
MSLLPGDHRSLDTQRGQWVKFQAIKKKYGCFSNVPTGAIPTSLERAVASECGCQEESRNAKEPKHVRPSCSHTHTPQTPRKRVRITGKETANQSPSPVRLSATPWTAARQASLSLTTSRSFPKFTFIASVLPSSRLIL